MTQDEIDARLDYIIQNISEGIVNRYSLSRAEQSIIELCKIIRDLEESEELNRKLIEKNAQLINQINTMLESKSQ